jgi:hypothetical protein
MTKELIPRASCLIGGFRFQSKKKIKDGEIVLEEQALHHGWFVNRNSACRGSIVGRQQVPSSKRLAEMQQPR